MFYPRRWESYWKDCLVSSTIRYAQWILHQHEFALHATKTARRPFNLHTEGVHLNTAWPFCPNAGKSFTEQSLPWYISSTSKSSVREAWPAIT